MSENNILDALEVVELYYNAYKDYEKAYANIESRNLQDQLKDMVDKGKLTEDFKEVAKEYVTVNTNYMNEVSFASNKFLNAAEFYLKTNSEELSKEMTRDYIILKNQEFKHEYSVKKGKFVKNTDAPDRKIEDSEFDYLFKYFTDIFKDS